MIKELVKIVGIKYFPQDFESRDGVKGPARNWYHQYGNLQKCNGYGTEKIYSKERYVAICRTSSGNILKTDLLQNAKHANPGASKQKNKILVQLFLEGVKRIPEFPLYHNDNSINSWTNDKEFTKDINKNNFYIKYYTYTDIENSIKNKGILKYERKKIRKYINIYFKKYLRDKFKNNSINRNYKIIEKDFKKLKENIKLVKVLDLIIEKIKKGNK